MWSLAFDDPVMQERTNGGLVPAEDSSIPRLALLRRSRDEYGEKYVEHLFEQYKLAVEMADRVSARRMQANSFFLGVNTALVSIFSLLFKDTDLLPTGLLGLAPVVAVLLLCYVWWRIVKSYRQLNSGKYAVVLELEKLLPVAPYAAEWEALGRGKLPKKYLPLTHIETWVPIAFGFLYLLLAMAAGMGKS
jgi:hypothetical protein